MLKSTLIGTVTTLNMTTSDKIAYLRQYAKGLEQYLPFASNASEIAGIEAEITRIFNYTELLEHEIIKRLEKVASGEPDAPVAYFLATEIKKEESDEDCKYGSPGHWQKILGIEDWANLS